ncbi:MAG: phenylalanine--tRNA ligase subunit beta [Candidatus Bipolaricaulota bacterium]|nr:phenylalanine--tRNA ligase subunit beta [Candidatus Bipolaricaulota bacterium]MDW8031870.1 phenylalanine--tRNA ligase subunit beta [Candidatus Bipolaricaulota bacterium]
MRVSLRWLTEFVSVPVEHGFVHELAERLTLAGLEVASVERVGQPEGLVVGKILTVSQHPHADKLKICEVSLGSETIRLVSGAPNLAENALVPVIRAGGRLPNGQGIEAVVFRGEKSDGMICSRAELGLEERSPGVWILEPELGCRVGEDFTQYLEFDDFILVLETKSNRPDALSVLGVAREVSALYDLELRKPQLSLSEGTQQIESLASVEIEDAQGCPRYACRIFSDLRWGPAPLKIQHRLAKGGLRPISNIVDATNYALLELGHPTHAFDYDKLEGHKIIVRRARPAEKITTLDGVERALSASDLVIADARKPVAIAGVMGGADSEVSEKTHRVLLESAYFDPISVRRTSKSLGLRTEASHRFERDMDPEIVITALDRVGTLLQQWGSCSVARGVIDVYPKKFAPRFCELRQSRISKILGVEIPPQQSEQILRRLEFSVERQGPDRWRVGIPSFRREVEREIDLIEEIGRIYGYEKIPAERPALPLVAGRRERMEDLKDRIRKILTALGASEAVNFGFISREDAEAFSYSDGLVKVRNPMSDESYALRPSLWPGLLRNVQYNAYQQVEGVRLFEIGKVFSQENKAVRERVSVGIALAGRALMPLRGREQFYDFYDLKGIVESLLLELRLKNFAFEPSSEKLLHPARQAFVKAKDDILGILGELHPDLARRYDLPWRVYLFEMGLEEIYQRLQTIGLPNWAELQPRVTPKFPASRRDLSLLVPEGVPEVSVRKILESERRVERVFLYDLYRGPQIPQGMKSFTYEITFRDWTKTLSDDEVNEIVARLEARLRDELGVQLRKI